MQISPKYIGLSEYPQSLHLQNEYMAQVKGRDELILLGFEYNSVITLGKRGNEADDLLNLNKNSEVFKIERGGQATLHNLGQLVIYPIYDLRANGKGVRDFILFLNHAHEKTLQQLGIKAEYHEAEGGVMTLKGKMSFTGLRIDQGISSHGLSVNINNELNDFSQIRACGREKARLDRVKDYNVQIELPEYFETYQHFLKHEM